jgi:hypothetical protein
MSDIMPPNIQITLDPFTCQNSGKRTGGIRVFIIAGAREYVDMFALPDQVQCMLIIQIRQVVYR